MKIAYLLLVHNNFEQLKKLLQTLQHRDASFYIHADRKSFPANREILSTLPTENIHLLPENNSFDIQWGGFSMVAATIALLKTAREHHYGEEKIYFVLLSGMDCPLKTNEYIFEFLDKNHGTEFIEYFPLPAHSNWALDGGLDRLKYYWFIDDIGYEESYRLYLLQKNGGQIRSFTADMQPYGGSQWWCLTGACVDYLLAQAVVTAIGKTFRHSYIPDETFFQTLIMNSPFKDNCCNNNLRYIDWKTGPEYPRMLTMQDLPALLESPALFARKIDGTKTAELFSQLVDATHALM